MTTRTAGEAARRPLMSGTVQQLALATVCAAYALGALLGWGSPDVALIMGDFGLSAAALLAAGSCLWYAHTRAGRSRPAWVLLGLSSFMISLGNGIWGWYELVLRQPVPRTSLADMCFLLFAPLAVIGLLMLARPPVRRTGWLCLVLDAWLIGGSLLALSWSVALAHTAQWRGESVSRAALALAYPVLDIALVSVVLVLHFRRSAAYRPAINTAICALALTVLCDALFTSPMLREQYSSGQLLDAGWFAGSLLLACAPWAVSGAPPDRAPIGRMLSSGAVSSGLSSPGRPLAGPLAALTPYLAAAVCTVSILITVVNGREVDRVVMFTACAVALALLARQGITLMDNVALTRELAHKENHFRSLVQGSSDVIMIAAPEGILRYVSPAAAGVYGREANALVGRALSSLIHPGDLGTVLHELRRFLAASPDQEPAIRIECRVRHGAGHWLNVESTVNRHQGGLIFNSRDVTERVRLQAQLQHSAWHDSLTDLPNRTLFIDRVRQAIAGRRDTDGEAAVFFIDLDGFKAVNDSVGHQSGDELLVEAARRLRESVRAQDSTARLGGDEFAVLITGDAGEPGGESQPRERRVLEIAERVRTALSKPYLVQGGEVRVAASIGVAFAEPGMAPSTLMRNADLAMYRAKQAGKARVEFYAPRIQAEAIRRTGLVARLRGAPQPGEYALLHQPVINLSDGRIAAVTAMPSWRSAAKSAPAPAAGIEPASWTLEEAVAEGARRHRRGHGVPVSVRVPPGRLAERALGLTNGIESLLARHGLPPEGLILELPEAESALGSEELRRRLSHLSQLGIGIALDGFGGSSTPMAALHRLPVGLVRLDRQWVDELVESPKVRHITAGLLRMAADLGVVSIAPAVDRPEQADVLRALGCVRGQGRALCEPLDAERLWTALDRGRLPVGGFDSGGRQFVGAVFPVRRRRGGSPVHAFTEGRTAGGGPAPAPTSPA